MLDLKAIRENPQSFKKALKRKFVDGKVIDEILKLDVSKREIQQEVESLKAEQNKASKSIGSLNGDEKQKVLLEMKEISDKRKKGQEKLDEVSLSLQNLMEKLPNPPKETAPDGKDDEDNVLVEFFGEKPKFDFEPKEHWELCEALDLLDQERSAKVSGSRFYYMKNQLAILQRALIFWVFMEVQKREGFTPIIPPFMTRKEAIQGTGFFDKDQNYVVNPGDDDLYLIGTSEVPMTSYFSGEILEEDALPHKFVAYSPCFRKEAGTYGKDSKGILRVHQFEKIEMMIFCLPEDSSKYHELIREIEEDLLQKMGIHYQLVNVCCGDLGNSASKKYDIEAWLPGQNAYREMTSTSICDDFQSRRLNIRVRRKNGDIEYLHTLNGTATSSRPLIAIMEQFQNADGSIDIPEVLQPLCGFSKIEKK